MPCSYFRTVKNFKGHMKICNGVNNYRCPHCKEGFQKNGKLSHAHVPMFTKNQMQDMLL